jgi:hypothetical protein
MNIETNTKMKSVPNERGGCQPLNLPECLRSFFMSGLLPGGFLSGKP